MADKKTKDDELKVTTADDGTVTTEVPEAQSPKLKEDSPTTDAGQVHSATGNPAAVTQEGRDIRDASQHMQALLTILDRTEEPLSPIQEQKLKNHPEINKLVKAGAVDGKALIKAMQEATTDQQRLAVIESAQGAVSLRASVALLREPEDPHADPVRDRPSPKVRVDN